MRLVHSSLVRSVGAEVRAALDALARAHGWPTTDEPARLGPLVEKLSRSYNDADAPRSDAALAARLLFSFPRDVPKGAGAVRELVASGALSLSEARPLRILDLGAGLGATSRGVTMALSLAGASGEIVIDATDSDADALSLASRIAEALPHEGAVRVRLRTSRGNVASVAIAESYDLIVLGQVLSELDRDADGATRVRRHVELLGRLAGHLVPGGSLVVVEPALRDRTRHLHAVRDALLEVPGDPRLWVRAPCVHDDPCPMLRNEDDWCHEDLAVDLPSWLVPVARAAGLRWQGLTFSYLVLGRGVRTESAGSSVRVVSAPRITKGKRELFLCGDLDATGRATCVKGMRLDRHRSASNADWDEAARGDVLSFSPPLDLARPRVLSETTVRKAGRD